MSQSLDLRVRQLHEAMGQVRTSDLSVVQRTEYLSNGRLYVSFDFSGGASEAALANVVSLFLANIASLKDHLKAWCKANQKRFDGETLINTNRDVAVIHDLWNRDKHCELKQSRSGVFPALQCLRREGTMCTNGNAGSSVVLTIDRYSGQLKTQGDGHIEVIVNADIVDDKNGQIGTLVTVAERAVAAWEVTLRNAGVPMPITGGV